MGELISTLQDKLRGIYRLKVEGPPIVGSNVYTRRYDQSVLPPLQLEAADRIDELEGEVAKLAAQKTILELTVSGLAGENAALRARLGEPPATQEGDSA